MNAAGLIVSVHHYADRLREQGVAPQLRGIWASVGTTTEAYGWKIHLSAVQESAFRLLDAALPVLVGHGVPFKVARDSDVLAMLNEGTFGPTQVGKFVTVYPSGADQSRAIAADLIAATRDCQGPRIITDLHLGGVVYTRYGSFTPTIVRDRLGNLNDASPDSGYTVPFETPAGIENPFEAFAPPAEGDIASRGVIGPGYLIVRPLNVHPKGSVFLALDLRKQEHAGLVVLKEARRHCVSDLQGRDMWDRLRHQAALHAEAAGLVAVPEAGPLFEHAGNLYLPLAYVDGRDVADRPAVPYHELDGNARATLLGELADIARTLSGLHACGIVHRDLTPRNVRITSDGRVCLIDLELGHRAGDASTVPFTQGTPGFTSPQQRDGQTPAFSDDVFSLGGVMIQGLTACDPQRVLHGRPDARAEQIRVLSGAPWPLCELAAACVDEEADARPSLDAVIDTLTGMASAGTAPSPDRHPREAFHGDATIVAGLRWLLRGAPRDDQQRMWVSPEIESSKHDATLRSPHAFRVYRSASRGVAGVVYCLSRLHRFGYRVEDAAGEVPAAIDWLLAHEPSSDDQMPGLHFGEAGVAVAVAESVAAGLVPTGEWLAPYLREALNGPIDWPDLTHGAAGQGTAALICARLLNEPALAEASRRCARHLLDSQAPDGSWVLPEGVAGMEGSTYSGFAHGVAGIVWFLGQHAAAHGDGTALRAAADGADWLLRSARTGERDVLWWPIRNGSDEAWRWWCHGGPGIALAFLTLFETTGERRYADAARRCLRIHPVDVRYGNMSQCHGLSGLGEILLEAHRTLGDEEWLFRAERIGATLRALARIDERGASWLVENPFQPTADLMIGCGGVVHFLARLESWNRSRFGMPLAI